MTATWSLTINVSGTVKSRDVADSWLNNWPARDLCGAYHGISDALGERGSTPFRQQAGASVGAVMVVNAAAGLHVKRYGGGGRVEGVTEAGEVDAARGGGSLTQMMSSSSP